MDAGIGSRIERQIDCRDPQTPGEKAGAANEQERN
jgi:hypothetical protein